jgi:hypothetical protein
MPFPHYDETTSRHDVEMKGLANRHLMVIRTPVVLELDHASAIRFHHRHSGLSARVRSRHVADRIEGRAAIRCLEVGIHRDRCHHKAAVSVQGHSCESDTVATKVLADQREAADKQERPGQRRQPPAPVAGPQVIEGVQ